MNVLKSLALIALSSLVLACGTTGFSNETGDQATLKLQGSLQQHYTNNIALKVFSIDGVPASRLDKLRKTFRLTPGTHSIVVTGDFEHAVTSVTFTLTARPQETYLITGRFDQLSNGQMRHNFFLQDQRGKVLQKKSATTRANNTAW